VLFFCAAALSALFSAFRFRRQRKDWQLARIDAFVEARTTHCFSRRTAESVTK